MNNRGRSYNKTQRAIIKEKSTELQSFEGLTPDPESLTKLEEYCPGITERWQCLAEEEIRSRHKNESKIVGTFRFSSIFGSISAFLSTVIISAVGLYAIHLGHATAGSTIIVGSMAQVVAAFHYRSKNKE